MAYYDKAIYKVLIIIFLYLLNMNRLVPFLYIIIKNNKNTSKLYRDLKIL